jgi:hypothetical protein
MTAPLTRELDAFARATGYDPSPCPACAPVAETAARAGCTNCGGSGRLWTSPRGSLSDAGLVRLHHLLSRPE